MLSYFIQIPIKYSFLFLIQSQLIKICINIVIIHEFYIKSLFIKFNTIMDNSTKNNSQNTTTDDNNSSDTNPYRADTKWDKHATLVEIERLCAEIKVYIVLLQLDPKWVEDKHQSEKAYKNSLKINNLVSELFCFNEISGKDYNIFVGFQNDFEDEYSDYIGEYNYLHDDGLYAKFRIIISQGYVNAIYQLFLKDYFKDDEKKNEEKKEKTGKQEIVIRYIDHNDPDEIEDVQEEEIKKE